ncbi:SDR family oxidoreductase [Amycolatopsis sp. NPDC051371]|uniref:SDR family oxidoreductase n=1 Tax=Amycolatopsis sp. NPDC051371 TaxID=3155800 RepID=UPI00342594A8
MDLDGKTVLITGGSRGIGQCLARRLGSEGSNVVVNFKKNADAAARTVDEVVAAGGRAAAVQADMAEPDQVAALVKGAVEAFGKIDVVVANAAASAFKPLSEIRHHHVEKTMAITLQGFLDLVQGSLPHMPRGGRILAVSGWDSFRMLPGHGLLGAAKAALESMIKYLALELGAAGVTAVGLSPGPIDTDSFRTYAGDQWDAYERNWLALTPEGRFTTPEEIAEVMAFFCSPRSAAINGQTVVVDGGVSLATMPRQPS